MIRMADGGTQIAQDAVIGTAELHPVPVPAALPLLGLGVAGLAALRRRKAAAA
jgi:PEP-CTERM putative exosortase interaction domain